MKLGKLKKSQARAPRAGTDMTADVTAGSVAEAEERAAIAETVYRAAQARVEHADALEREAAERLAAADARERAAIERERAAAERERQAAEQERIAAERLAAAAESEPGERAVRERVAAVEAREQAVTQRDAIATQRDRAAVERDILANQRDRAVAEREAQAASRLPTAREDEPAANGDALARADLEAKLQRAHLDSLTGTFRREMGRLALRNEIERARRSDGRFVIAFLDVDGLKAVNDREGHAAGDRVLRMLAATMRANLRSYDPIVRYGGDEFVCGIASIDPAEVQHRIGVIDQSLRQATGVGISAGLASLTRGESLEELTAKADEALLEAKRSRGE